MSNTEWKPATTPSRWRTQRYEASGAIQNRKSSSSLPQVYFFQVALTIWPFCNHTTAHGQTKGFKCNQYKTHTHTCEGSPGNQTTSEFAHLLRECTSTQKHLNWLDQNWPSKALGSHLCLLSYTLQQEEKKKKNKWKKKKKKKPIWLLASFRLLPRFRNITTSRPIAFYTRRWATSKYSEVPYEIIDRTFSNLCVSYLPHTRSSTLGKVHSSHADTAQGAKHAQNPPQVNRTQSMERGRYEKKRMNKNL